MELVVRSIGRTHWIVLNGSGTPVNFTGKRDDDTEKLKTGNHLFLEATLEEDGVVVTAPFWVIQDPVERGCFRASNGTRYACWGDLCRRGSALEDATVKQIKESNLFVSETTRSRSLSHFCLDPRMLWHAGVGEGEEMLLLTLGWLTTRRERRRGSRRRGRRGGRVDVGDDEVAEQNLASFAP
jgi:hypothetical protein